MTIDKFSILGERCSGTNFLEEAIINNFNISYTAEYGNKHFFCYNDYNNSNNTNNTLFIGIVRNPIYWINSFSTELHHIPEINRKNIHNFLFNEFYSVEDEINTNKTIQDNNIFKFNGKFYTHKYKLNTKDLNYKNGKKYKNIFELRKVKNDFLMNEIPNKVKNYILINYEDLLFNYSAVLQKIKEKFNLNQKNEEFIKIKNYKKSNTYNFVKQRKILLSQYIVTLIWENLDKEQENLLGYKMWDDNNFFKSSNHVNNILLDNKKLN
jgi:hypothetical protein